MTEGLSEGEFIEIEGNLQAGDLLVTEGVERLRPYDEVAVLNPPTGDTQAVQAAQSGGGADESGTTGGG